MTRRFLVVDVGATDIKWAVAIDGALDEVHRTPTSATTPGGLVTQLSALRNEAAAGAPLSWALCVAGLVDTARGRIVRSPNLGLEDEPIVERLAATGARPHLVVNDVAAAAVGEAAGTTLALLQIGTGVAGRVVIDGSPVSGVHGFGGEVGHLVFMPGGRLCTCGRAGCVEAYAGMAAIRRRYGELGLAAPSASQLIVDAGVDAKAAGILEDVLAAIAFAAAVLVIACDPGTLRLGGGVAAAWGETLRAAVEEGVADRLAPGLGARTRFEISRLGERAPLIGLLRLVDALPGSYVP